MTDKMSLTGEEIELFYAAHEKELRDFCGPSKLHKVTIYRDAAEIMKFIPGGSECLRGKIISFNARGVRVARAPIEDIPDARRTIGLRDFEGRYSAQTILQGSEAGCLFVYCPVKSPALGYEAHLFECKDGNVFAGLPGFKNWVAIPKVRRKIHGFINGESEKTDPFEPTAEERRQGKVVNVPS